MKDKTIFTLMALILLVGCSQSPEEKNKKLYLLGCTQSGLDAAVCECSYNKLTEKYPPEFFSSQNPDDFPEPVIKQFFKDSLIAGQICLREANSH